MIAAIIRILNMLKNKRLAERILAIIRKNKGEYYEKNHL